MDLIAKLSISDSKQKVLMSFRRVSRFVVDMLRVIVLNIVMLCQCSECCYAEFCYAVSMF